MFSKGKGLFFYVKVKGLAELFPLNTISLVSLSHESDYKLFEDV
jgi:hypothetical protein